MWDVVDCKAQRLHGGFYVVSMRLDERSIAYDAQALAITLQIRDAHTRTMAALELLRRVGIPCSKVHDLRTPRCL